MVAHVVEVFDPEAEVAEVPRTPPPTPAEPAAEVPVAEAAPEPEAPAAETIPTSMVAHVVEVAAPEAPAPAAAEEPALAPAPVELESWKKDAFEAVVKNSSVHDVVPVAAQAAPAAPVAEAAPAAPVAEAAPAAPAAPVVEAAPAAEAAAPAEKKTYKIVMIRHGESEWNNENRFCGWFDAGLSDKGKKKQLTREN